MNTSSTGGKRDLTFAVVIPVYNGRAYLSETLRSVLAQTYPAQEIIVIEDGSPVSSADLLSEFPSVRYVTQTNSGVSASRNHGAALATSEWVCFLDQDDLLRHDHLEQFAETLSLGGPADLLYTPRCILIKRDGVWVTEDTVPLPSAEELRSTLLERCPFPPSGTCVNRTMFQESGGYLSRYDLAEDWEFWLRCMLQGRSFVACSRPTVCYRVHAESNSHRPLPILRANKRVIDERIAPALPWMRASWTRRRLISRMEAEAAILLRQMREHGAFSLLLRSILRFPAGDLRRYLIASHMLLSRMSPRVYDRKRPASAS